MTTPTKRIHIGDILSITTGRLVAPTGMNGISELLCWMTDDVLFTHQLVRASQECEPTLQAFFPDLADIVVPDWIDGEQTCTAWLGELEASGVEMWRDVPRVLDGEHALINPLLELQHMIGADKVIPIVIGEPT